MLLATVLILLIVFLIPAYYYLTFYFTEKRNRARLPGPKAQWLLGNLNNTGLMSGRMAMHEVLADLKCKYGDTYSLWVGPHYSIVLSRIEDIREVFRDRQAYDVSSQVTASFGVLFPNGLIALRGDDWKRHARFILPMFKRAKILPYLDTIVSSIDEWIDEHFVKYDGQIHTDLVSQCQNTLLNIIARIAFDYDLEGSTQRPSSTLRNAFNDFVHYAGQFVLVSGIPIWLGKLILSLHWKYQRALNVMKLYVMNIISEERKRQENENVSLSRPKNLIASLVSSIKSESSTSSKAFMTSQEVFDEISMSILAGFETTATALSWFIFYMSKYPEVQEKVKDELREHHLTHQTPLTQDLLDSLTYIECVAKEVLRFAPIAASIARDATCDGLINNISVKRGDIVVIATQNLHQDPRYWNIDPTKFLPERFLDEDKYPPAYVYMPFGGGHRACAGQELAFFELKIALTRLMQRVTFEDPGAGANNSGGFIQRITCYPKHLAVRVHVNSDKKSKVV